MPFADYDEKLAYQRKWYGEHRERVIAKVRKRRRTKYVGRCDHCGGKTYGDRPLKIPRFCSKPACKSVHRKLIHLSQKTGRPY